MVDNHASIHHELPLSAAAARYEDGRCGKQPTATNHAWKIRRLPDKRQDHHQSFQPKYDFIL